MRPRSAAIRALAAALGGVLAGTAIVGLLAVSCGAPAAAQDGPAERATVLAMGPWPLPPLRDPRNPASHDPAGIALGEALFHSARLSPTGVRCASCHEPWRGFVDARVVAQGVARGTRNTPSLLDAARHRHFGWEAARDTLWLQSLQPLVDPREMPATEAQVAALLRGDATLAGRYAAVFGARPGADDAGVTRDAGLALAAYVETLASPRTPFDDWRDRLAATDTEPATNDAFPTAARRGLRLFAGAAGCASCHAGPTFSDDRVHASLAPRGRPALAARGDAPDAYRTPGLRGVAGTAPYLHDGSVARLCDAVRPHAADTPVRPPELSATQRSDLVAFLRTLSPGAPDLPARCDP